MIDYYEPDIVTAQDYYPFGMMSRVALPNSEVPYKFGFNGKMNDNEVKGGFGLQQDYGMRIYDSRVGRFLSLDPLQAHFPWYTPYQFSGNTPIQAVDLDGREERHYTWVKDNGGNPKLIHLYDKPIKERVIVGYRNSHSLYNDGAIPVYETKVNAKQVFILHEEREGTVEKFDKVQFVTYDQTTSYQGYSDMLQKKNGTPGFEKLKFYLAKGAQNMKEENSANGGAGMYVNSFRTSPSLFNIYGEGEVAGFTDVSVTAGRWRNGRPLTSSYATGSAERIVINNSPINAEEVSEILRLSKSGTSVSFTAEGTSGKQYFDNLANALKEKATLVSENTEYFYKGTEYEYNIKSVTYKFK